MTKQPDSTTANLDRPAPTDVVITPQMIEAGIEAYGDFDPGWSSLPERLEVIFKSMSRAGLP